MGKRPFFLLTGGLFLVAIAGFLVIAAPFRSEYDPAADGSTTAARAPGIDLETPTADGAVADASSSSSEGAKDEAETASRRAREAEEEALARRRAGGGPQHSGNPSRPTGPGGSHLYTGTGRGQRLNPQLLLTSDVNQDAKIAENERSNDVADKRGSIVGAIASVDTGTIAGWAYDWNDLGTVASVDVFVDGSYVQTVQASFARPTFDPTNPQNPINQRAWVCPSPPSLSDGDRHVIVALGYRPDSSSKTALQSSPWTFGGNQWPQGQLLWVTPTLIYGWANDPNNPGAPVTITITGDGAPIAKITTSPAQNAAAYAQALAASPSKKSLIQLDGLSGPADPNLGAVLAAKVQAIAQGNHYLDMRPLAAAGTNVGYDEYDFVATVVSSDPVALPGTERAAVKFWQITDGTQAFVYVPAQPLTASWIQVQVTSADGTMTHDVTGSPQQIGGSTNRLPIGAVCFVSSTQISGWAADPDVLPGAISVDVVIDGVYFGRIRADQTFAALPNAVPSVDANHAFVFAPPNQYLDGKTHSIQFFGVNQPDGVNPELGGSPTMFVGQKNNPPQGFLDVGNTTLAAGWAYDPDAGAAPVSVEIWIDNALYQTVTANQIRPDLVPIVAPEPTHGFSCSMPDSLNDGKFHSIRAFAINVPSGPKQELAASPKEINAQAPYIGIWVKDTAQGLQISQVAAGRAGATAGLCAGDIIRAYDGNTDKLDYSAFIAWVQTKEVGEQVVFRLWRDPSLPAPPPPNPPVPSSQATPPLGTGERLVIVTLGSR